MSSEEEMDMDDRHDRAEEERRENCSHTDLEGSLRVILTNNQVGTAEQYVSYLTNSGTELFDLYLDIKCCDCGSTQENLLDKDELYLVSKMLEAGMVWVD
jgi:hypothetical protein